MPFIAGSNINAGQIVSLASNGSVLPGFGMQLSGAVASAPQVANPIILNMTGTITVLLYNDTNYNGQAIYYDTSKASPSVRCAFRLFFVRTHGITS